MSESLPKVGISACLLGEQVRYDGGHKLQPDLLREFEGKVEWVPVCPEVELGLGTPREPIRLEGDRLVGIGTREDLTERMQAWSLGRLESLQGLCGYVFKSRSPSCGVRSTPVFDSAEPRSGVFAREFTGRFPDIPVAEETALASASARRKFLSDVRRRYRRALEDRQV